MRFTTLALVCMLVPAFALAGPSVVGSMQGWDPADASYDLSLNGNGIYELTKTLVAGYYEYKVTETDAFDGNDFPANNQNFTLAADGDVTWYVNLGATVGVKEGDEYVFHSMNPPIVAGDMQSELGGSDWDQTDTVNTVMSDGDNDGVWVFSAVVAPAGDYQCKVVLNNNWDQNTSPGGNISFTSDGTTPTTWTYDMSNNTTTISNQVFTQQDVTVTFTVCAPDSVQATDMCVTGSHPAIGSWMVGVDMFQLCPDVSPGLWTVDVTFPAGSDPFVEYKYKKDGCTTWESTGNHSFTIDDSSATQVLPIDGWEYIPPECPDCMSPVEDSSWGTVKSMYR
jgi:hypothetical protein